MKYSFGIDSLDSFWELTQKAAADYLDDDLNSDKAITVAQRLWHMCDWFFKERGDSSGYSDLRNLQRAFGELCPALRVMRDIANGTKHAGIDRGKPVVKKTKEHKGSFSRDFSRDFDISVLEIDLMDGNKVYFDDRVREVLEFWSYRLTT